jgi:hypothetical protein
MSRMRSKSIAACVAVLAVPLVATLAGCGGGGGDSSPANSTAKSTSPTTGTGMTGVGVSIPVASDGKLHAACSACSAADDTTYSGSGAGVWQAVNPGAASIDVPVSIKGLSGQNVTLVYTNEGTLPQVMPSMQLSANLSASVLRSQVQTLTSATASATGESPTLAAIRDFNYKGWTALAGGSSNTVQPVARFSTNGVPAPSASAYSVGATRTFFYSDYSQRTTTLRQTMTTSDGTTVNLWVEDAEYDPTKVSAAIVNTLITKYAQPGGIYDMLTRVGGPLYGPNTQTALIDGTQQPIDLVVMNFDHNNQAFGLVGYFWALNNFKKGTGTLAYSNESVSLYLDSETLYLGGTAGQNQMLTTMAHESLHMQNFYRRAVLMGAQYAFEPWLEEMTAMMMEDWSSGSTVPGYNAIRDTRYPTYLTYAGHGSYNCGLTTWTPYATDCESYAVNGSFGGFLNRQFGLSFYQALLNNKNHTVSLDILNEVIGNARAGSNVPTELRHFASAASGLIALSSNLTGYTFPARSEGGFTLPAIDPSAFGGVNRALPVAVPATLAVLGTFPVVRPAVRGTYNETVHVPVGSTLSVVVE